MRRFVAAGPAASGPNILLALIEIARRRGTSDAQGTATAAAEANGHKRALQKAASTR